MSRKAAYTVEDIRLAVAESRSFAQVLTRLGLKPAGGNYKYLKARLDKLEIDYTHFSQKSWAKGVTIGPKRPLAAYLTESPAFRTASWRIKRRMIHEGILDAKCANCGLREWMWGDIPLELDHVNGVNTDNRIENLRLLCPNCHALTPTYRGRNKNRQFLPP